MPKLLDASWDPPFSRKNCQSKMSALIHRARRRCTPEVFMGYCRASLTKVTAIPRLEAASVIRILRMGTSTATGLIAGWIEAGFEPVGSKRLRRWRMGGIGCAVLTVASGGSAQQQEVRDLGCERARLRPSGGAHAGEELVDLDTQGIGLMLELAGVVAHHVRGLPGLAGRVGEAGDLLAHHAGALANARTAIRPLPR